MQAGETALRSYAVAEFAHLPPGVAFLPLPGGLFVLLWGSWCSH